MDAAKRGGVELRKLHVVYFLTRKGGGVEHPHLLRVHHLSRNGVRLRDVKRWLGELRGEHMPESFSWSYKRKYRTGYVWQDLQDDDLITPISDDEYVLKGTEISHASTVISPSLLKVPMEKQHSYFEEHNFESKDGPYRGNSSKHVLKSSSEIEEFPTFGSESSTLTDDSMSNVIKERQPERKPSRDRKTEAFTSKAKRDGEAKSDEQIGELGASSNDSSLVRDLSKNKRDTNSCVSNNIFRNMIRCGEVDTNDSAVVAPDKHGGRGPFFSMCSRSAKNVHSTEIRRLDRKLGGPYRIYGTPWNHQHCPQTGRLDGLNDSRKNGSDRREQRTAFSAAYKPVSRPNCSQCGKQFKPEKLHAHMKSCKGKKGLGKSGVYATATARTTAVEQRPITESHHESSISGYFLTR